MKPIAVMFCVRARKQIRNKKDRMFALYLQFKTKVMMGNAQKHDLKSQFQCK